MEIDKIYEKIVQKIEPGRVLRNEQMKKHTSFQIGGPADIFVIIQKEEELRQVLDIARKEEMPVVILGNGTNMLVKDGGIRGIVIKPQFNQIQVKEEKEGICSLEVGASIDIKVASKVAQEHSLTGFEFACGIPGSIGGGVRMNAGAYGGEMKDILDSVRAMRIEDGKILEIQNTGNNFQYRNTVFYTNEYVVLSAKYKLKKGNLEEIKQKMADYTRLREKNQPLDMPSAGSTFKRGNGFLTSLLIEQAGLKGKQIGGAAVSEKHGGFIVNKGGATARDVLELVNFVKREIKRINHKDIELEVEVIGEE